MASVMRGRVSIKEFANYFSVSRPTIHAWLRKYNAANKEKYDPKNIKSVFEFFEYLQKQFS
jgi:transposase